MVGNNITLNSDVGGIYLLHSSRNTIVGNSIEENAVCITLFESSDNVIVGNSITANSWYGIDLSSSNNSIYHNNFVDNWRRVESLSSSNAWDNGYPSGGNFWSDYNGEDSFSGPYQNETGSDNIGDTPYIIDENNRDNYPLMNPFEPLLGDVNLDGKVDIFDVVSIVSAYGSKLGNINWNPLADIAPPFGTVNIFDIVTCTQHYGETWGA